MDNFHTSKFLSFVLRHKPQAIGIILDSAGWVNVEELIEKSNKEPGIYLTPDILAEIVESNNKKRFEFDSTQTKIRASQGHSVEVDLGYKEKRPPTLLYHGTSHKNLPDILQTGLTKQKRHHVHLTTNLETAMQVGTRYGNPVVLKVDSYSMFNAGNKFYQSTNGVWLTDFVAPKYLTVSGG